MKSASPVCTSIVLVTISLLLSFALVEIGFRVYLTRFAGEPFVLRYGSVAQIRHWSKTHTGSGFAKSFHRYVGFIPTPNFRKGHNRHNSLGYRGAEIAIPKPAGEYRIVCLGGSTTYTTGVEDYRKSYPAQLQKRLRAMGYPRVRVVNAGTPGWTSWESLINFELRVLDLDPDLIIVYHSINDIHARLVWPPAAYKGDNSGRSVHAGTGVFMPGILEYSTAVRYFLIRFGLKRPQADIKRTIDRRASTFYGAAFLKQKLRGTYPSGIFERVSARRMLAVNRPIYFRRNLENIGFIARRRHIAAVFASFAFSPRFEDRPRASSAEYVSAYREQNAVIREVARTTGSAFYDFAAAFPRDKRYYVDGRHVTEAGARLKAGLFARFLAGAGLLPGRRAGAPAQPPPQRRSRT